jgi:two-component system nitrogen regulation response regulator GlnG
MDPHSGCNAIGILLLDDERSFRMSLSEMLRDDGHEVREYAAPADLPALATLGRVGILVTDYEMPGKNGLALADDFHTHHPHLPVILITAYRTQSLEAQALDRPFLRLMSKPIDYEVLHALIHDSCSSSRP